MPPTTRRDFLASGLLAAGVASAPAALLAADALSPDSLEALARVKGLHFGTALGGRGLADPHYVDIVLAQCGILVPENELKMPFVQPAPGEYHFERAEKILGFAEDHGLMMRGHCLIWHHPKWLPHWLDSFDFGADPARAAEDLIASHVRTTTTHFGTRIASWDVVNEAVDNVTGEMRETVLSKAAGSPDTVLDIAFRAARASLPDTELVYNDYMGWEPKDAPHRNGVLRLLERLKRHDVPVTALGIQGHIGSDNNDGAASRAFDARDEKAWRKFLEDVTGMGYKLLITEFDVHDGTVPGEFPERDAKVAALGRAFLDITLSFRQVNALLCWGLVDSHSWLQARAPRRDGMPKRPNPYDNHYQPKPLREAIAAALKSAPDRRFAATAGIPA